LTHSRKRAAHVVNCLRPCALDQPRRAREFLAFDFVTDASSLDDIGVGGDHDHHVVGAVEHVEAAIGIEATDVAALHLKHNPSGWNQPDGLCRV